MIRYVSDFDKDIWRKLNHAFLIACVTKNRKLQCQYLELLGLSGYKSFEVLKGILLSPKHFLGIDCDPEVFFSKDVVQAEFRKVFHRDAYNFAQIQCQRGKLDPPIGVFNFDDTKEVGSKYWVGRLDTILTDIVPQTISKLGYCAVILNATTDKLFLPGATRPMLHSHAEMLVSQFRKYGLRGPSVSDMIGKPEEWDSVSDKGYVGMFNVYKSANAHMRMATVRLFFRHGKVEVWKG